MRRSNELSWSAQRCQRLETRMFSTSSFPRLKTGSWKSLSKGRGEGFRV